jgi:hypothetical protein
MAEKNKNMWIWVVVIGVVVLFATGVIKLPSSGTETPQLTTPTAPSDLKCTLTLYTRDALATSTTPINVSYFLFNGGNNLKSSGSTSGTDGSATITMNWGSTYKILAYYDESGTDFHAAETSVTCDTPTMTKYLYLNKESNATISKLRDPTDFDENISATAGSTLSFDILYKATTSNAAVRAPMAIVDANLTSVVDVAITGATKVTCPTRISTTTGRKNICFDMGKDWVKASDGTLTIPATVQFSATTAPSTADQLNVKIADQATWQKASATTYSDFVLGAENSETYADVGAGDSASAALYYNG